MMADKPQGAEKYDILSPESWGWFWVSVEVFIQNSELIQRRCMRRKILELE